jgi:hypothetical protein
VQLQVTRDRALRNWIFDETALNMHMNTGSGYPGGKWISLIYNQIPVLLEDCPNLITSGADPGTKQWFEDHSIWYLASQV